MTCGCPMVVYIITLNQSFVFFFKINETSSTEDLNVIFSSDANQEVLFNNGYRSVVDAEKKDVMARWVLETVARTFPCTIKFES